MKKCLIIIFLLLSSQYSNAQIKILFDASKAETAGNADWVIDSDLFNLGFGTGPAVVGGGNESNPQRFPTPLQSTVISTTTESYWKGGISAWGIDCVKKGYQVETLPYDGVISYGNSSNPQDLSNYKVFIVDEPNIVFTASEKTAIVNFVKFGGSLFMISDHTVSDRNNDGWDSPAIWNNLFTTNSVQQNPFGITFDLANFSGSSSNITSNVNDSLVHGTYGNATQVLWSSGTSITINSTDNASVKASVFKTGANNSGNTNILVAYAYFGLGKVVAVGDSSPFDDGSGDTNDQLYDGYITDAAGNHQKLIMNATVWLATTNSLPVELLSFNANQINNYIELQWQTATEINTNQFNIQYSVNGIDFKTIGNMVAKGSGSTYYFQIPSTTLTNMNNYFRLEIEDKNGTKNYSKTISINLKEENEVNFFPNPTNGIIHLYNSTINQIKIIDISGRLIEEKIVNDNTVNLSNLPKGFYTLFFYSTNKLIQVKKLIIN